MAEINYNYDVQFKTKKCEYEKGIKLYDDEAICLRLPRELILKKNTDYRHISIYIYLLLRVGLDNKIILYFDDLVKWCGYTPDNHKGAINDKIYNILDEFVNMGIFKYEKIKGKIYKCVFYKDKLLNNNKPFTIVYLDEIKKIRKYENYGSKLSSFNLNSTLILFCYLRSKIWKRSNELRFNDISIEDIRKQYPETYCHYFKDIATELNIPDNTVSKGLNTLKELKLIYFKTLKYINNDGWKTGVTIFTNFYKRENNLLFASGEDYYLREIRNKEENLEDY